MKAWFSGVKITEVIASDPFGIDTVIGAFVTENILGTNGLQGGFQIQDQLAKISGVFGVIRFIGKQDCSDLLCCNARTGAVHQHGQKLFRFFSFKRQAFSVI